MRKTVITTAIAALVLVNGCVVEPAYDPYYDTAVRTAPPPLRSEYPGYPPAADYLWINGYWNWIGVRYEWVPGRWEAPRPGYYWTPHQWERDGAHWRQQGGRWEQDTRPRPRPTPTATPTPTPRPTPIIQVPRSEPQSGPKPNHDSAPKYQRDNRRPPEPNPTYRPEHGNAPPRIERDAHPSQEQRVSPRNTREDKSRSEHTDDARANRRRSGDEH